MTDFGITRVEFRKLTFHATDCILVSDAGGSVQTSLIRFQRRNSRIRHEFPRSLAAGSLARTQRPQTAETDESPAMTHNRESSAPGSRCEPDGPRSLVNDDSLILTSAMVRGPIPQAPRP
jgi:hypothetical protein